MVKRGEGQPLQVVCDPGGCPVQLRERDHWLPVLAVLDRWQDTGCWWEGESAKRFFRLQLAGERTWEVFLDLETGDWHLYKIYD